VPAEPADAPTSPLRPWRRERSTSRATGPQCVRDDTTITPNIPPLEPTWEQKPVAVLAACHAELGMFAEGRALGDEGLRIAEAVTHPASLMLAL
jgi:hypothetical protein